MLARCGRRACRPTSRAAAASPACCGSARCAEAHRLPFSAHCAPAIRAHALLRVQPLAHLEYFHDHVRIESHALRRRARAAGRRALPAISTRPGLAASTLQRRGGRAMALTSAPVGQRTDGYAPIGDVRRHRQQAHGGPGGPRRLGFDALPAGLRRPPRVRRAPGPGGAERSRWPRDPVHRHAALRPGHQRARRPPSSPTAVRSA